ncbi:MULTISPECIES: serine-tRNA(Ala) deacylase AlaX [Nostocales]|jgi:alanyl-tRNA synthetase|uniref:Serine-tRNA(Ala) deacylase AlaX n=1 Tax=Dolichospermum flos-aquae UHCC 0037 TaxID=2590026 RepID=A0ACC7S4B7_DOLFA|nr:MULTISPECIES: serine-tRNA(Ala) deacylase AlaX [Nostocales]AFW95067.1 alanyl-tRNA synthetase [Anabaena sp. 90]MBO1052279.1 serine-tRNA(Ala) deacylase AlaX [Dolichospermum sp. DET73]MBO1067134.1 serine-tRNA(Ala) deacylase AlaX [Anabaena sp. 54]MTJ43214.1 serine-tRNA(Ala) deacylase AlaX [Dolichospermum flos-aquae UHCC 0037]
MQLVTNPLYMIHQYQYESTAKVTDIQQIEFGGYNVYSIHVDETIFHPQGGGQRSDKGRINDMEVDFVQKEVLDPTNPNLIQINHIVKEKPDFEIGSMVILRVDEEWRFQQMSLHSAGHILAALAEEIEPNLKAVQGHHFPGEAKVTFIGSPIDEDKLKLMLEERLDEVIRNSMPLTIVDESGVRKLDVGGLTKEACGGTHLTNANQISSIKIRNIKSKKQKTQIGYEIITTLNQKG